MRSFSDDQNIALDATGLSPSSRGDRFAVQTRKSRAFAIIAHVDQTQLSELIRVDCPK